MSRNDLKILVFVLVLAFGLRLSGLGFESLWLDECYQTLIEVYGHPMPDFASMGDKPYLFQYSNLVGTADLLKNFSKLDPVCPPLYAVMLNAWLHLFGGSDIAIRFLSCLTSLLGVAAVYVVSRSIFNPQAALLAGLLMAVSPFDIAYAQEARMYSLAELAAVVSFGSLIIMCRWKATKLPFLPLAFYVVATWALVNSHYTALFIALAGGLWGLIEIVRRRNLRLLITLTIGWLAVALLWVPWLSFFFAAASIRKGSLYVTREFSWSWPYYALFFKVPVNWLSYMCGRRVAVIPLYATAASFLLLALRKTLAKSEHLNSFLALWFWVLVPALGIWMTDVLQNNRMIEVSRYLIGTAPAIYMLCGAGLALVTKHYKLWSYVLICHVILAMANNVYQHLVPQKEPWRQMAQMVESNVGGDMLFVCQPYDIVCLDRYLHSPRRQIGLSTVMNDETVANAVGKYNRFWLITALDGEAICARLPKSLVKKQEFKLPRGLILRSYEAN